MVFSIENLGESVTFPSVLADPGVDTSMDYVETQVTVVNAADIELTKLSELPEHADVSSTNVWKLN